MSISSHIVKNNCLKKSNVPPSSINLHLIHIMPVNIHTEMNTHTPR